MRGVTAALPGLAWAYLVLLALLAVAGAVTELKAEHPPWRVALRVAALAVLGAGVVLYFSGGAGAVFAVLLLLAVLVQVQRSVAETRMAREKDLPAATRVTVAARNLTVLPAIALGALAVWSRLGV